MDASVEMDVLAAETNTSYKITVSANEAKRAYMKDYKIFIFSDTEFATILFEKHINTIKAEISTQNESDIAEIQDDLDIQGVPDIDDVRGVSVIPDISEDSKESGTLEWTHSACLLFIETYKQFENTFHTGKSTAKACWSKVADCMNKKGYEVSWDKCAIKFNSMKSTYKSISDNNKKSGARLKKWIYYEACDEIFKKKPWVDPLATASSVSSRDLAKEQTLVSEPPVKKLKLDAAVKNYLDESLAAKKQASEVKIQQHEAKLQRLDKMNALLEQLMTSKCQKPI